MAITAESITKRYKHSGTGYLDAKMDAVANIEARDAISKDYLEAGMIVTVLDNGNGEIQDFRVKSIIGTAVTWESGTKYVEDKVALKADETALQSFSASVETALAGKAATAETLAGYGITDAKIDGGVITLGSNTITPITSHQDISGKADKATTLAGYNIGDAKIESGVITLGNNTITPITSHQDISGKADKATTLAGYGITDAKIDGGVITLGTNTITPITSHQDISGKQDKLTAGDKISIVDNTISVTGISVPTKTSELTNDSGFLTAETPYTAGEGIKIENHVISYTGGSGSAVLTSAITTDIAVGHIASGTTYAIGTSIEKILRDMLVGSEPVVTYETLNITFGVSGEGSTIGDIQNIETTINYDGEDKSTQTGTNVSFSIPNGKEYTIKYASVNGYTKPTNETYTAVGETTRSLSKTYVKQVVGEKYYYALVGDTGKTNTYFDNGTITEEDVQLVQHFTDEIIASDFTTASGIASTAEWTLNVYEDTGIISILVPTDYKMSSGSESSVKTSGGQNIIIDDDPQPQTITYNGVECKVYSKIYDDGYNQNDTLTITFFEN